MSTNIIDLIYGKDETTEVVAVEVRNKTLSLFRADGSRHVYPYKFWLLTSRPVTLQHEDISKRLDGHLHFQYINYVDSKYDIYKVKEENMLGDNEFHIVYDPREAAMVLNGVTLYKDMKLENLSVLSFDIETVGLTIDNNSKTLIISNTYRSRSGDITKRMFSLDNYQSQQDMIAAWCNWVTKLDPHVLCGHNIFGYDLPYLEQCSRVGLPLGKSGMKLEFNKYESYFRKDGSQGYSYKNVHCFGRQIIDTFFLSIHYDFKRAYPSYSLKQIIKHEGLEREQRQHYDASKIVQNWDNEVERVKIKAYAIDDADDSLALFDLMIPSYFYYAQSIPKTLQQINNSATGSQINSFLLRSYLQQEHSVPKKSPPKKYEGAISFGNPGIYDNVLKVDVASLYPSIIQEYNVWDRKKDPLGSFPKMVRYFTEERLENKRLAATTKDRYYDDMSNAQKIVINSAYGMLGAAGLNFNCPDNAAFVTEKGREICQTAINWAEVNGYKIVNADTDSISYTKGRFVDKKEFDDDLFALNALYPDGIVWEDDGTYEKVIVIKAKNYVLWDGKKLTTKGSALKDQKKEPALKEMLQSFISAILDGKQSQIKSIYHDYVKEAHKVEDITRWCAKKTVTEAVLKNDRAHEAKVRDALGDKHVQEGDKVYVYPALDGVRQKTAKGKLQFYKDGRPKLEPNTVLKLAENWNHDHNVEHLLQRIYDTAKIMNNIFGSDYFLDYTLKRNKDALDEINSGEYESAG